MIKLTATIDKEVHEFPFKHCNIDEFLDTDPSDVDWLIKDRVEIGRGVLISGLGGSSKTRLLYHLAIGVCIGKLPWEWEVSKNGKAVLLLNEDRPEDVHRIIHGMNIALGLDDNSRSLLKERLIIYPLAGESIRLLMFAEGTRSIVENGFAKLFADQIKQIGNVVLVGLDPALSITPGDENDQSHQRALGKLVDDLAINTGAAVVLVAHAAKTIQGRDEIESHSSRGGGAITDAVRAEMVMRAMTPKEAKAMGISDQIERRRHVQLAVTKANNCPPEAFTPVWLRRGEFGALAAADIQPKEPEEEAGLSTNDLNILKLLHDLCKERVPKLADWRTECIKRGYIKQNLEKNSQDQAMKRTISRLMKAGEIKSGSSTGFYVPADARDE